MSTSRLLVAYLGIVLSVTAAPACSADDADIGPDAQVASPDGAAGQTQLDTLDTKAFSQVEKAYGVFASKAAQVWNEAANSNKYDLSKMPLYLVRRDAAGKNVKGYLLNRTSPPTGAVRVEHSAVANLGSVYRYDGALAAFGSQNFEFFMDIEGVKSYVFPYSPNQDDGTSPDDPGFWLFLVHEGFHRYQMLEGGWTDPSGWVQSDETTYPLTSEFVALILLEDKILLAALATTDAAGADTALEQLIAVRTLRAALSESTVDGVNVVTNGDSGQEWNEGTPTYVERAISLAAGVAYDLSDINSIGGRVAMSFAPGAFSTKVDAKSYFASTRQYGSGGAIGMLLDRVSGVDWRAACKGGTSLFASAVGKYNLSQSQMTALVSAAKTAHAYDAGLVPAATAIANLP